jgi:hypothetical protein
VTTAIARTDELACPAPATVTRWPPPIGVPFTIALSRSGILPGDGNYRETDNTGIMAMTMNGIAKNEAPGPGQAAAPAGTGVDG